MQFYIPLLEHLQVTMLYYKAKDCFLHGIEMYTCYKLLQLCVMKTRTLRVLNDYKEILNTALVSYANGQRESSCWQILLDMFILYALMVSKWLLISNGLGLVL